MRYNGNKNRPRGHVVFNSNETLFGALERIVLRCVRAMFSLLIALVAACGIGSSTTCGQEIPTALGPTPEYLPFPTRNDAAGAAASGDLPTFVPAHEVSTATLLAAPPTPPAPKSGALRPLGELVIQTRLPEGGALPMDMSQQAHATALNGPGPVVPSAWVEQRPWMSYEFAWVASNMVHRPLYFEDLNLERYGNSACPALQPAISAARFAAELSVLPYQMTLHRPRECIYLLGYCRPGSKAPNLAYVPPLRLDAAAVEAAAITGAVFIIP
jgi:hypothetical protein